MRRTFLLLAVLTLSACATVGPPRPTLAQALASKPEEPAAVQPYEVGAGGEHYVCGAAAGLPPNLCAGDLVYRGPVDERTRELMRQAGLEPVGAHPPAEEKPSSTDLPSASPFSAGLLLGAGVYLDGSGVLPAQLAVGSVKVLSMGKRAVNLLALGGISATSVSEARGAWGAGASVELTPGTLPYEVDAALGVLWVSGGGSPAALLGFTLTPKM